MAIEIMQLIQPWYESEEFGRVMAVARGTLYFGELPSGSCANSNRTNTVISRTTGVKIEGW